MDEQRIRNDERRGFAAWVECIRAHLPRHMQMAARDTVETLAREIREAVGAADRPIEVLAMLSLMVTKVNDISRAQDLMQQHRATLAGCVTPEAMRRALEAIIDEERSRGRSGDRRALGRWLDAEAVDDRDADKLQRLRQGVEVLATYLAASWRAPRAGDPVWQSESAGSRRGLDACLGPLAGLARTTTEPWTLRVALVDALSLAGARLSRWRRLVAQMLLDQIADCRDDPWVVAAALRAYVDSFAEPNEGRDLVREVLLPADTQAPFLKDDHALLRARAVGLAGQMGDWDTIAELLARPDPSEHVRCEAMRVLARSEHAGAAELIRDRLLGSDRDASRRVRAVGVIATLEQVGGADQTVRVALVGDVLAREDDPWVLETVADALFAGREALMQSEDVLKLAHRSWSEPLGRCASAPMPLDLRRRAAALLHWMQVVSHPPSRAALLEVEGWAESASEGEGRRFSRGPVAGLEADELARLLVVAAIDRQDLAARPARRGGYRLDFGARRAWAPWRMVHELLHRAPDKRQAHDHTHDTVPRGRWIAVSTRMSEVTPSRVPGRRVAGLSQLDWGDELPLPSLLVAGSAGAVELLTPLERVSVQPRVPRVMAWWRAQRNYVKLARTRQSLLHKSRDKAAATFDRTLDSIGFAVERRPWYAAAAAWTDFGDLVPLDWLHAEDTTLGQLALFGTSLGLYWVGRSIFTQRSVKRLRRRIPLVVGGWGSRGKSGTERLKAALFEGLGYRVLCKTTGCEAAFLATSHGSEPVEIMLYRGYDKATIWEQIRFLRIAAGVSAQVVLWECMALVPDYVRVLQRDWMQDDLSTITNTYPDHEDVQGPAGRDVAEVIGSFIGANSRVFTSEQHMTPVLRQSAREQNTVLEECTTADWRLLPADLMERFPYAAHPRNVALVAKLAGHLEVPRDVALRAMADHVLPDVGVLKEYGPAAYSGRSFTFVNGMSANERAGCLSNWQRMRLEVPPEGSGLWERVVILVNNRADRPSRQSMFARICAADLSADSFLVVGTNVAAFQKQLVEDLRAVVRDAGDLPPTQWIENASRQLRRPILSPADALAVAARWQSPVPEPCIQWAARLEQLSITPEALGAELRKPAPFAGDNPVVVVLTRWLTEVTWLWSLRRSGQGWSVDAAGETLVRVLVARTVSLHDPGASGDAILELIAQAAPPDSNTRIYGVQNIKGTGLSFVNRWLSVERVERWLAELDDDRQRERWRDTLAQIAAYQGFGVIDGLLVEQRLSDATLRARLAMAGLASSTEQAAQNAHRGAAAARERLARRGVRGQSWLATQLLAGVERFADSVDSIRRARAVERVYNDLAHRRIGRRRAAQVIRAIHRRQSGGWLRH